MKAPSAASTFIKAIQALRSKYAKPIHRFLFARSVLHTIHLIPLAAFITLFPTPYRRALSNDNPSKPIQPTLKGGKIFVCGTTSYAARGRVACRETADRSS